jgi:hypothetical protein
MEEIHMVYGPKKKCEAKSMGFSWPMGIDFGFIT